MNIFIRVAILAGTASLLARLWYPALPQLFESGIPSITEDADFAMRVRLSGFLFIVAVVFFFAVKNLMKK